MNTKQVEELTGMSRQNIRYYERMGLLEPARDDSNAYRDYSEEDVRRLKLIRMLRMLDMPLKDIQDIINEKASLREAVRHQKEILQTQQKQLNAAIEVCTSIGREKDDRPDVDGYLSRMETMEKNGGLFARFVDDYKQVVHEEQERKFSFYTEPPANTAAAFEKVLRKYAADHGQKFRMLKKGKYPEFVMGTETYTAVQILEKRKDDEKPSVKIVCEKKEPDQRNGQMPAKRRRALRGIHIVATNIRRYGRKSILNLLLSMLTVMILAFYLGNIAGTRRQLEEMPGKFTISGEIWNGCGEMNHGLFISHRVLDDLYESPLFGSIAESAELVGNIAMGDPDSGELDSEEKNGTDPGENDISLTGVNRTECLEGMKDEDIAWGDGVDWESFQKSSDTCLVSEIFAKESGLAIGDTVRFDLARYSQGLAGVTLTREELLPETFRVEGIYKEAAGRDGGNPEVLLPLDAVKGIYEKNDKVYFASALSFELTDPMMLNEAKKALSDAGLKEIIYGSPNSYVGIGVKLTDSVFIRSMESADRSLTLLESFLPFIFLIVAAAGYIIPSLLFQNRREEYAVMRALGTGSRFCSLLLYAEHILPAAAGSLAGAAAGMAAGAVDAGDAFLVWGAYLAVYMLGAAAAMWRFGRFSIAAVLSHRD
ncbi:hypothetical protein B5F86_10915 [Lachnoclostridium sp. An298]|nr:hypothetical protein B5F86_10915 [Lachnoclostridium sp. An298]